MGFDHSAIFSVIFLEAGGQPIRSWQAMIRAWDRRASLCFRGREPAANPALRYAHSTTEVADLDDIENLSLLVSEMVQGMDASFVQARYTLD